MIRPSAVAALCLVAACSEPAPRVRLLRVGGSCGAAGDARTLLIRALGDEGEVSRAVSAGDDGISDLPAVTRQLAVTVLGVGGAVRSVGKTAPFSFGELPDGATIPIAMVPQGTACPTEPMIEPRLAPAMARAGRYVLLLGGQGARGPLVSAELYDPATDRFEAVEVPSRIAAAGSFLGAVATTLADGRVVISGGPTGSYMVFDPETKRFGPPIVLEPRFFHGAVALGGDELLIAGGCRTLNDEACGTAARTTLRLRVDTDDLETGRTLGRDHVLPALLLDPGVAGSAGSAARGASVLVLGSATAQGLPVQAADRLDLDSGAASDVPGTYATAATLDSGAVLTGFSTGALAAITNSAVLSPQLAAREIEDGPALRRVSLTTLEDGSVLALGQSDEDRPAAAVYRPTLNSWSPLELPPALVAGLAGLADHRALLLEDGSVLIVGAGAPGAPSATAWRFRPSLLGPFAGAVQIVPTDQSAGGGERAELTPSDPAAVDRTDRFELLGNRAGLGAWAIAGGPRLADGKLTALVRLLPPASGEDAPGLAVISHFQSAAALTVTQLVPGQPATMQRLGGAEVTELCRGQVVPAIAPDAAISVELTVRGGAVTVRLGAATVLECTTAEQPRGAWGLGVVGAGVRLGIDTVSVQR